MLTTRTIVTEQLTLPLALPTPTATPSARPSAAHGWPATGPIWHLQASCIGWVLECRNRAGYDSEFFAIEDPTSPAAARTARQLAAQHITDAQHSRHVIGWRRRQPGRAEWVAVLRRYAPGEREFYLDTADDVVRHRTRSARPTELPAPPAPVTVTVNQPDEPTSRPGATHRRTCHPGRRIDHPRHCRPARPLSPLPATRTTTARRSLISHWR